MFIFWASLQLVFLNGESRLAEVVPVGGLADCITVTKQLEKVYLPNPTVKVSLPQCEYRAAPK